MMVNEMGMVCGRRKLKVNENNVMKVSKSGEYGALNAWLNRERMEELDCFRYFDVDPISDGVMEVQAG